MIVLEKGIIKKILRENKNLKIKEERTTDNIKPGNNQMQNQDLHTTNIYSNTYNPRKRTKQCKNRTITQDNKKT